ncbi:MAG: Gfo/Idh/MocA family oxidoreductase, partial [Alphaproteobacteria bacterium]
MAPSSQPLGIGIAGLGVASTQVLPAFTADAPFALAAGADIRPEARAAFQDRYGRPAVDSVEALCRRDDVDAVWIATPNTLHAAHVVAAAKAGKHVVCEKPMAVTLKECDRMIRAAAANGVQLLQGHSKIYQAPIRQIRDIVKSGRLGRVVQILSYNSNDWLQRPRLAPELDTGQGGGLVYRQGPHMIDIVRFIGGGLVKTVRGVTGRADPNFDTEGHFSALLEFEDGAGAAVSFNGYGYFDVSELTWDIGESGWRQEAAGRSFPGKPRITGPADAEFKSASAEKRAGPRDRKAEDRRQPFFGLTIVNCEKGVIRQSPNGIFVYSEDGIEEIPCPAMRGRDLELRELIDAIDQGRTVFPDGRWGMATLEVCLA